MVEWIALILAAAALLWQIVSEVRQRRSARIEKVADTTLVERRAYVDALLAWASLVRDSFSGMNPPRGAIDQLEKQALNHKVRLSDKAGADDLFARVRGFRAQWQQVASNSLELRQHVAGDLEQLIEDCEEWVRS